MKRGFGIGLLLLASALLLVTLGITLTVPGDINILETIEIIILLLIQLFILSLVFADNKWGASHFIIFIIAILGIGLSIKIYLSGLSDVDNLSILAVIAVDLLGFVLAIFGATDTEPAVPKRQTRLQTFDVAPKTEIYDIEEPVKDVVNDMDKDIGSESGNKSVKEVAKKVAKRGRPKGSTAKKTKKTVKKTSSEKSLKRDAEEKPAEIHF